MMRNRNALMGRPLLATYRWRLLRIPRRCLGSDRRSVRKFLVRLVNGRPLMALRAYVPISGRRRRVTSCCVVRLLVYRLGTVVSLNRLLLYRLRAV